MIVVRHPELPNRHPELVSGSPAIKGDAETSSARRYKIICEICVISGSDRKIQIYKKYFPTPQNGIKPKSVRAEMKIIKIIFCK